MLLGEKDGNLFIFFAFHSYYSVTLFSLPSLPLELFVSSSLSQTLYQQHSCCRKYIGQIFTDSLVHDAKALKYLVETIGQVNIAYNLTFDSRKLAFFVPLMENSKCHMVFDIFFAICCRQCMYDTICFFRSSFKRAFKLMKNGVYYFY